MAKPIALGLLGRNVQNKTYIRMLPDLFDHSVIKVTRVSQQTRYTVGMLQAFEDGVDQRELGSLPELQVLAGEAL